MRYPISVCMIVKNEEDNLVHSIASIRPFVEEIHVVDTGSTDQTCAQVVSLGAHLHHFKWSDDFSAARNYSLSKARQPHILVLDADEVFDPTTESGFRTYLQNKREHQAGQVQIQSHTSSETGIVTTRLPRLFPNHPDFRYTRRIHEQLQFRKQDPEVIETVLTFLHTGYTAQSMQQKNKIERNLRLLFEESNQHPSDPYVTYQIAKTYYVNQQYEQAADFFQRTVDQLGQMQDIAPAFLPSLLLYFGYSLMYLKQFSAFFQVVSTAIDLYPDFTHLYFLYGQALIALGDETRMQDVRSAFEHCLQLGDTTTYETVHGVGSFLAEYNLGVYFEVIGDLPRARSYYERAAMGGYDEAANRLQLLRSP